SACATRRIAQPGPGEGISRRLGTEHRMLEACDCLGGLCDASNHVASRSLIHLKLQLTARLSLFEQLVERCKSVEGLIEAWLAPFQRLLDHRSPELCRIAFFRVKRVYRLAHEIYSLLPPILRCLRRLAVRLRSCLCLGPWLTSTTRGRSVALHDQ